MKKTYIYVGTHKKLMNKTEDKTSPGDGIYSFELDCRTGKMTPVNKVLSQSASILCVSPHKGFLYSTNETRDFDNGLPGSGGGVSAYKINKKDGSITFANSSVAYGANTAYVSVSMDGKYLLAANHGSHSNVVCSYKKDKYGKWKLRRIYDDSNVAVFKTEDSGKIGELTDLIPFKQSGYYIGGRGQSASHIHCVGINEKNIVICCNRGGDRIEVLYLDKKQGKLKKNQSCRCKPGLAPRHLAFHPTLPYLYICNENFPCVTAWKQNPVTGKIRNIQTVGSMPDFYLKEHPNEFPKNKRGSEDYRNNDTLKTTVWPADIKVSPNGKNLYVSNRSNVPNDFMGSISVYSIDQKSGRLIYMGYKELEDRNPRGFAISPDGNYVVIAQKQKGKVCVYRIDEKTGKLLEKKCEQEVASCSSICFAEFEESNNSW